MPDIRILSLVKGLYGGVGRYAAMLSRLNGRPGINLQTVVLNHPKWLCNREDLDAYDLEEVRIRGLVRDSAWVDHCIAKIQAFDPDLLFVHGDCLASGLAWVLQRRAGRPLPHVASYHGLYHASRANRRLVEPFRNWLTPLTYRKRTLAVVTVAEFCRQQLISKGVDGNKITVVHNGIAPVPPKLEPVARAAVGLGRGDVVVGVISRLDHVKGMTYLLDAAAWVRMGHPEVHVVLVGDGGSTGQLRRQSQELGISSHVHFVGYRDNASAWLDLFDIFAMPSLAEYHSIGLLEAMRAGKAIVATDVGGNTESVRDGQEALVIPARSARHLAEAMTRLIEDRMLARRLSDAARRRFASCFTIDHMLDGTEVWLRQCVRMTRSRSV